MVVHNSLRRSSRYGAERKFGPRANVSPHTLEWSGIRELFGNPFGFARKPPTPKAQSWSRAAPDTLDAVLGRPVVEFCLCMRADALAGAGHRHELRIACQGDEQASPSAPHSLLERFIP